VVNDSTNVYSGCSSVRIGLLLFLLSAIWLNVNSWQASTVAAQDRTNGAPPANPSQGGNGAQVKERELETFYLEAEDGSLKKFFNIPFEKLDDLNRLYLGLQDPDKPPRFVLRSLRMAGEVKGDFAFMTVSASAVANADGWVRIPLRMNQAMLLPGSEDKSDANNLLEFDQDSGLVWRVKGKAGEQHSLEVEICTKLRRLGPQTHLELSVPKATTSRMQLTVPEADVEPSASENVYRFSAERIKQNKTRVTVDGIGGRLRLAWQKRQPRPKPTSIFSATADVQVRFESQRRVHAEAAIRIDVTSGLVKSLIVQLPPKMQRTVVEQPGAEIKLLPTSDPRLKEERSDCQYLEVVLQHPSADAINFRLRAHRTLEASEVGQFVEVSGFRVLNTVSQSGTLSLAADAKWAFQWTHDSAVEQVEQSAETRLRPGVAATFHYSSQPYAFRVKISRKERRIHIEPRYELTVTPDRVLLQGTISYRIRGAEAQAVTLNVSGWDLKEFAVNDEDLFESELPDTSQPISVPLGTSDEPLIRDFDLSFSAELYLPPNGEFTAGLPQPESTSRAPAEVTVRHADNIELVPLPQTLNGLTEVDDSVGALGRPMSGPVVYRGWTKPDQLVYGASVRLRPTEIAVSSSGKVALEGDEIQVNQELTYRVLYQAVPRLMVSLPTTIVESKDFRLSLEGAAVQPQESSGDERDSVYGVGLDAPQLGSFRLQVEYSVPVEQVREADSNWFAIPLASPTFDTEGRVSDATLTVEDRAGRDLRADESWEIVTSTNSENPPATLLRSSAPPAGILRLHVSGIPLLSEQDTIVQVAWLQTWISESRRNDRLAVRLTTNRDQIRFRLPLSAELEDVALERRRITQQVIDEAGDVIVKLPPSDKKDSKIVEIWYSVPLTDGGPGQQVLDLPQLIDTDWTRRFYWQLVLPRDEHLVSGAKELNPESSWSSRMPLFGRTPRFDQRALEQLVGASEQLPLPESTNEYLFSSQDAVARIQITTASRGQILLVAAVTVFVVGLLLIYVPSLRHPASLLMLCVIVGVVGLLFPHPTIQLAQLSAIGLLFVLLTFALKWLLARSRTGPAILHGTSLSSVESVTTETMLAPVEGSSHTSTKALIPQTSDSASE